MLKRPLITEKTMTLAGRGFYTFEVDKDVTKLQIAKLVADRFKVDVLDVHTVTVKAKQKMQRSRKGYMTTGGMRKAIVQVKAGQRIALFETLAGGEDHNHDQVTVTTAEGEPVVVKEKKSLLKGTKVKVEKVAKGGESKETK